DRALALKIPDRLLQGLMRKPGQDQHRDQAVVVVSPAPDLQKSRYGFAEIGRHLGQVLVSPEPRLVQDILPRGPARQKSRPKAQRREQAPRQAVKGTSAGLWEHTSG